MKHMSKVGISSSTYTLSHTHTHTLEKPFNMYREKCARFSFFLSISHFFYLFVPSLSSSFAYAFVSLLLHTAAHTKTFSQNKTQGIYFVHKNRSRKTIFVSHEIDVCCLELNYDIYIYIFHSIPFDSPFQIKKIKI